MKGSVGKKASEKKRKERDGRKRTKDSVRWEKREKKKKASKQGAGVRGKKGGRATTEKKILESGKTETGLFCFFFFALRLKCCSHRSRGKRTSCPINVADKFFSVVLCPPKSIHWQTQRKARFDVSYCSPRIAKHLSIFKDFFPTQAESIQWSFESSILIGRQK